MASHLHTNTYTRIVGVAGESNGGGRGDFETNAFFFFIKIFLSFLVPESGPGAGLLCRPESSFPVFRSFLNSKENPPSPFLSFAGLSFAILGGIVIFFFSCRICVGFLTISHFKNIITTNPKQQETVGQKTVEVGGLAGGPSEVASKFINYARSRFP